MVSHDRIVNELRRIFGDIEPDIPSDWSIADRCELLGDRACSPDRQNKRADEEARQEFMKLDLKTQNRLLRKAVHA